MAECLPQEESLLSEQNRRVPFQLIPRSLRQSMDSDRSLIVSVL